MKVRLSNGGSNRAHHINQLRVCLATFGLWLCTSAYAQLPPIDSLTENNASSWGVAAAGPVSILDDTLRVHNGSKSIHIDAPDLYSAHAWTPKLRNANWNLNNVSFIRFWAYIETGNYAFFPGSPVIRLGTTEGDYIEIEIQTILYPTDPPPGVWHEFIIPISGATAWQRTEVGSPDLSAINYVEIFANTWDYGFDLWLDGLGFLTLSTAEFDPNALELFESWRFTPITTGVTEIGSVELPAEMINGWSSSNPAVANVDTDGRITAISAGTTNISAIARGITMELPLEVVKPALPPQIESIPAALAQPAAGSLWEIPVLVIRYLPTSDGTNLDTSISPDYFDLGPVSLAELGQTIGRFDHRIKYMLEEGSRFRGYGNAQAKPSLGYRVVKYITVYEPLPPGKIYGLDMGQPIYLPDYTGMFDRFDLNTLIDTEGIREIWLWSSSFDSSFPSYDPLIHKSINARFMWESNMSSPSTGDISNSNRDNNDLPVLGHTYVLYGQNFRRTQAEAIHNHGHQLEAMLSHASWLQDGNSNLFWHEFVGQDITDNFITGRCGWTHMPPNTINHYDYENSTVVMSDCKDWKPGGGTPQSTSKLTWMNIGYIWPDAGPIPQKTESQFYIFWMQNMPGYENGIPYGQLEMTNWWYFTADWDAAIAGAYGLYGIAPSGNLIFFNGFE